MRCNNFDYFYIEILIVFNTWNCQIFMRSLLKSYGYLIQRTVLFFYPPFHKFVNRQIFLYGVTGVVNILFDWALYFSTYNFILRKENLHVGIFTLSPHIAALIMTFPISFSSGFLLQKYVTFSASPLHGKTQIVRYLLVVALNFFINFVGIKLLVDCVHLFPTPSKMIVTVVTVFVSYLLQKRYTFRV